MSVLEKAIGLLSPSECINCGSEGLALCGPCSDSLIPSFGERCWRCNRLSLGGRTCQSCRHTGSPAFVWIVTDHDNTARDLLSLYKFGHNRAAAQPIAGLMSQKFLELASQNKTKDYLVIPVPTATSRARERGFGHAELLAKKISSSLGLAYANNLRRLGQARQLGARREDRLKQLTESFLVKSPRLVNGQNILLIDDVVTTGGTLIAATQALRRAGAARVDALLFAKRL